MADAPKPVGDIPDRAPLVALRNALLSPGAVVPLRLTRVASRAAIEQALSSAGLIALFAQTDPADDTPGAGDLHPVGSLASVTSVIEANGALWVVVRTLAWLRLTSIDYAPSCALARVEPFVVQIDGGDELTRLEAALRARARAFAATLPDLEPALARLERMSALELADAAIAALPCELLDKASFVSESSLLARLKWLLRRADRPS